MTNDENEGGANREELLQRVALMEAMIAEGRRSTTRYGWLFVLWGLVDLTGMGWQWVAPHFVWVWPATIFAGFALMFLGKSLQKKDDPGRNNIKTRSIQAVWSMMGLGLTLYCFAAMLGHVAFQLSYLAAILMMVGLAHAISGVILRWTVQCVVAGLWWVSAMAVFFAHDGIVLYAIVIADMLLGMVVFGVYAMMLERSREAALVQHHA
jgi:hypothetical protein